MKIQLSSFISDSIVDGEGIRAVIFTQGCPHNCPGCHNQKAIPFEGGLWVDCDEVLEKIYKTNLKKVTFSGGEPFVQAESLYYIASKLKEQGYNLWSYTGYKWEALMKHPDPYIKMFLECLDILVDGRFMIRYKNLGALYRGSTNQRIIDVKESLKKQMVCLSKRYVDPVEVFDRNDDIFI